MTRVVATGLVVLYAWWAVALTPFSGAATVAVVLPGLAAMTLGARQQRARLDAAAGWWGVLLAMAAAWQLAAYLQHPRSEHPTLSSLTNALLDSHAARAVAFVLWLAAARELARR
jgi:hypothetical protein